MCRLLAVVATDPIPFLEPFRALARTGTVPSVAPPGHLDGWGLAAYRPDGTPFRYRSLEPADTDAGFADAIAQVAELAPPITIAHLRKASVGSTSLENTQPLVRGRYAFCHNGTLADSDRLALSPESRASIQGTADSERVFLFLLESVAREGSFADGIADGMAALRRLGGYTALNLLISDGTETIAVREVDESHPIVVECDLCDAYYSLGTMPVDGGMVISSQPVGPSAAQWEPLPNHGLGVIQRDGTMELREIG